MVAVLAVVVIIALIPLNINQKVGYQIAIDGVEREIALENPKITSLLGALGMEQEVATTLLDSFGNESDSLHGRRVHGNLSADNLRSENRTRCPTDGAGNHRPWLLPHRQCRAGISK